GPVDDSKPERAAEIALLDRRERIVGDDQVRALALGQHLDLVDLAPAEVERGGRGLALLGEPPDHLRAPRLPQPPQVVERFFDLEPALRGQSQRGEKCLLSSLHSSNPSRRARSAITAAVPSMPPDRSTSIQQSSGSRANHVIWRFA